MKQGASALPEGPPAHRGLPLAEGISNYDTFAKPEDDHVTQTEPEETSIHRIDDARSIGKEPEGATDVVDWTGDTSYWGLGKSDGTKPKKPNRDDRGDIKMAHYVANHWMATRTAAQNLVQLTSGLNPVIVRRAQGCSVTLKRVEPQTPRWIFAVDAGHGPRVVIVRALRKGNTTALSKLNLQIACSCPAWKWWGPEFHATTKEFQDPKTPLQGTAAPPDVRDPDRVNFVCKHVAAVLVHMQPWLIGPAQKSKKKG